jgi:acetoin utilization deacetylase AcuC-like enzyme
MQLTQAGMLIRDQMVLDFAVQHKTPTALAMAGGYGKNIESTVAVHLQTIQCALAMQSRLRRALA